MTPLWLSIWAWQHATGSASLLLHQSSTTKFLRPVCFCLAAVKGALGASACLCHIGFAVSGGGWERAGRCIAAPGTRRQWSAVTGTRIPSRRRQTYPARRPTSAWPLGIKRELPASPTPCWDTSEMKHWRARLWSRQVSTPLDLARQPFELRHWRPCGASQAHRRAALSPPDHGCRGPCKHGVAGARTCM